jgi:hypothetical protein
MLLNYDRYGGDSTLKIKVQPCFLWYEWFAWRPVRCVADVKDSISRKYVLVDYWVWLEKVERQKLNGFESIYRLKQPRIP